MTARLERGLIAAVYFFGLFFAGFVLLVEREDHRLRAHALRAFLFHVFFLAAFLPVACVGTWLLLSVNRTAGLITIGLSTLIAIVGLVLWIGLLVRSNKH